jgi:hypothetical protein
MAYQRKSFTPEPEENWATLDGHQGHLLQVGTVDLLLGELIEHLEELGTYDETMIIVTADHGASYIPGEPRRALSSANRYDIGLVPLIIKEPHQVDGGIDDRLIQAVDVIPTIADMLGADGRWPGDGMSFVGGEGRSVLHTRDNGNNDVELDVDGPGRGEAVQRIIDRFGESGEAHDLFAYGPFADLVGTHIDSLPIAQPALEATIDDPSSFSAVALDTGMVPAYVTGTVSNLGRLPVEPQLALVVNGVIGSVIPLFDSDGQSAQFGGVVDDSLFRDGRNDLSVLSLYAEDGQPVVNGVATNIAPTFSLGNSEFEELRASTGEALPIDSSVVTGYVDSISQRDSQWLVSGWAVDHAGMIPAEAVALFVGNEFVASVTPSIERPDVVDQVGSADVSTSGFTLMIPASALGTDPTDVRVYGISQSGATELVMFNQIRQLLPGGGG